MPLLVDTTLKKHSWYSRNQTVKILTYYLLNFKYFRFFLNHICELFSDCKWFLWEAEWPNTRKAMVVHKCPDKTTLPVCKCNSVSCSYRKICSKKGIKWLSLLNYLTWMSHCFLNNAVSDLTFFSASVWNLILSSVWSPQAERLCKLWVDTSAFY